MVMASKDQQITQLMEMGFGNNRVVRALQATAFKVEHSSLHFTLIFHVTCGSLKYVPGCGGRDGVAAGARG